ncbi:MAG: helix-turn-helix transcriptional regulator [Oscillibacter sp.]|nr:helix-turn-helix transcriptional regulator [Oscillibacter sp.]
MRLEEKLTVLRKESGYTQLDLAEKVRVSRQAISKWETGRALPSAENLKYLSELFGVSVDYLLNDDMTEEAKPKEQEPAPEPQTKEPQTKEPQTEEAVFPEKEKGKPVRWKYIAALLVAVLLGLLIGVFVGKYSERHISIVDIPGEEVDSPVEKFPFEW